MADNQNTAMDIYRQKFVDIKEGNMSEAQKQILEMLKSGKISVEEAEKLLSLTGSKSPGEISSAGPAGQNHVPKYFRVVVNSESGDRVNIRVPLNLIRAGIKLTSLIPPKAADRVNESLKENGIDFDLHNLKPGDLEKIIEELGELQVDVDSNSGDKVHIFVE